ncbi:hypothetical protein E2986_08748 [Frieseomelitta varia]|uniref:Uncharacterized protein n=1 Tax=Frieseomelitta varia TaxID=561572 RepID=A0A833RM11_9HYME|nr:hypothetical protein E2986_08748 [Frieseomelitta varia]
MKASLLRTYLQELQNNVTSRKTNKTGNKLKRERLSYVCAILAKIFQRCPGFREICQSGLATLIEKSPAKGDLTAVVTPLLFTPALVFSLQYNIKKREEVQEATQEEPNPLMRKKKTPEELAAEAEAEDEDEITKYKEYEV